MKSICIFCGSNSGNKKEYTQTAQTLGHLFVKNNITLVYGGATNGIMGIIADTVMKNGGTVVGVIPTLIADRELSHKGISTLYTVGSMSERKTKMVELADAFITLPGGVGTMDELFEVLAFSHLGINEKMIGILNVNGYYDTLMQFIDHAVAEGFVPPRVRSHIVVDDNPETLLHTMKVDL
jgi:uncharacterized protein (TIGR00730 family)